ncbi:MAG: hypothetical protein GX850_06560 [Clostridiaceae bacterium]|nr:hypothetical protein [Clostridiaceae bacterium]
MPCYTGSDITAERFFPGWLFVRNEPFIQNSLASLQTIGLNPAISSYSFCTNGSHYAGEAGIRTLEFGPSFEYLAHTIDEYIEIPQLESTVTGYLQIIDALAHTDH